MKSAVAVWPHKTYVFRAVLGSLVAHLVVANGPGQKCPLFLLLLTAQVHTNRPYIVGLKRVWALEGAVSGLLAPVKASKEVPEHRASLGGHPGRVLMHSQVRYLV